MTGFGHTALMRSRSNDYQFQVTRGHQLMPENGSNGTSPHGHAWPLRSDSRISSEPFRSLTSQIGLQKGRMPERGDPADAGASAQADSPVPKRRQIGSPSGTHVLNLNHHGFH